MPGSVALAFIHPYVDYHNLMCMGYVAFYVVFFVLYEKGKETNEKYDKLFHALRLL